jgi:hypothetical protein
MTVEHSGRNEDAQLFRVGVFSALNIPTLNLTHSTY